MHHKFVSTMFTLNSATYKQIEKNWKHRLKKMKNCIRNSSSVENIYKYFFFLFLPVTTKQFRIFRTRQYNINEVFKKTYTCSLKFMVSFILCSLFSKSIRRIVSLSSSFVLPSNSLWRRAFSFDKSCKGMQKSMWMNPLFLQEYRAIKTTS